MFILILSDILFVHVFHGLFSFTEKCQPFSRTDTFSIFRAYFSFNFSCVRNIFLSKDCKYLFIVFHSIYYTNYLAIQNAQNIKFINKQTSFRVNFFSHRNFPLSVLHDRKITRRILSLLFLEFSNCFRSVNKQIVIFTLERKRRKLIKHIIKIMRKQENKLYREQRKIIYRVQQKNFLDSRRENWKSFTFPWNFSPPIFSPRHNLKSVETCSFQVRVGKI